MVDAQKATDKAIGKVQAAVDAETEKGFRGVEVDPTPNEHYTVSGVTAGKPTPETDQAKVARDAMRDAAS